MKRSKMIMIASILSIAIISISLVPNANAKEAKKKNTAEKVAHITYEQATQNANLLNAMYEQIDNYVLSHTWPYYTFSITYNKSKLYIKGSYQQWSTFFLERDLYRKTRVAIIRIQTSQ